MAPSATRSIDAHGVPHRPARTRSTTARRTRRGLGALAAAALATAALTSTAGAASVGLGTLDSFSVLGGSTVINTGPSVLNGDLGLAPGSAVTGFPPGTVNGTVHANDGVALQAQADLVTAYDEAAGRSSDVTVSADLAGLTLTSGTYTSATSLGLTGDLTLDGQGNPDAVFVFQAGTTLTTASGSHVLLIGGAQACNVFWQVGSSATIGTATAFVGNILALQSISLTTGATMDGRALARNGAVTLDTNVITRSTCATPVAGGGTGGTGDTSTGGTGGTSPTPGGGTGETGGTTGAGTTTEAKAKAVAPKATTGATTGIGSDTARLGGTVRPGSAGGTSSFQYGRTKGYGGRTPSVKTGKGTAVLHVGARIKRLKGGTVYHYRIVVTGPGGHRTFGRDRTFRTHGSTTTALRPPRFAG